MTTLKHMLCSLLLSTGIAAVAAGPSSYDTTKPFGYCTRSSRTNNTATYNVTGGGAWADDAIHADGSITLTADGTADMGPAIMKALETHSIVVLDGAKGDFVIGELMRIEDLTNKTIIGINGAKLCTKWYVTPELTDTLNRAGVPQMSTNGRTGGRLSNGKYVSEQAEYNTRQIIINMTGDEKETYRESGIMLLKGCENFIIRNIFFQGPGSIDVGGSDLLSIVGGSRHVWVDHCDFRDGMDGNFDITQSSDFITVSWCTFAYTERAYMHQNTNLVGYSDKEPKGFLNVTYAYNHWGKGCHARMPMARAGRIHMLCNYYDCFGNPSACINPRMNSEVLIEGNYFAEGIKHFFSTKDAEAWTWTDTNHAPSTPKSKGKVAVPYQYNAIPTDNVPTEVKAYAGATLTF
ncbi:MAG: hypothetical protein IKQ47_09405 [Prevotella sp.]|nr:hypothetical protein [Prevotella sp.]